MLSFLVTHSLALLLGIGVGWYAHYRFGARLSADLIKIKSL